MESKIIIGLIALFISLCGFLFTLIAGRNVKRSFWLGYIFTIVWPLLFVAIIILLYGLKVLALFGICIVVGIIGETLAGSTYYKITGERLWDYQRLDFKGQTSLLMIPLWGSAGVLFWFFAKIFNI